MMSMKGTCEMLHNHDFTSWDPEDSAAWEAGNKLVARRNLVWGIVTSHIGFSIWYLFSVMVLFMPEDIYGFSTSDKLLIDATASLVGAAVRIPYPMLNAKFGGRNWTFWSSVILMIPTILTIVLLAHPGWPLWPYLVCAALTAPGGANYTASLANVDALYPQRLKGYAMGLVGGISNLGSASIQAVGLLVIAIAGNRQPYWVCAIYLVALSVGSVGAALYMDNLKYRVRASDLKAVLAVPDTWLISFLYLCFSGSYLGFAFAFGQLLQHNFVLAGQSSGQAALHASEIAFIGPLLGGITRIYGGRLSDRFGGGHVSLALLFGMILGGGFIVGVSTYSDHNGGDGHQSLLGMAGYVIGFMWLFAFSGAGKASVYKLIPSVFRARSHHLDLSEPERNQWALARSGSAIGLAGAFGSFGGVGINLVLRQSYKATGTETPAFWIFLGCYVLAAFVAWARYVRPREIDEAMPTPAPQLTGAEAAVVR